MIPCTKSPEDSILVIYWKTPIAFSNEIPECFYFKRWRNFTGKYNGDLIIPTEIWLVWTYPLQYANLVLFNLGISALHSLMWWFVHQMSALSLFSYCFWIILCLLLGKLTCHWKIVQSNKGKCHETRPNLVLIFYREKKNLL